VVATDAVESVKPEIHRRRQRLTVVLPEAPVWLYADAGRWARLLLNLLGNAAKYADTGVEVRLSIEQESEVASGAAT
jgi:signal transduction histidine kinase